MKGVVTMRTKMIFWLLDKSLDMTMNAMRFGKDGPGFKERACARLIKILSDDNRTAINEYCRRLSADLGFQIMYDYDLVLGKA